MTNALQSLIYSSQLDEKEAQKRWALRLDLNICRVLDEVTSDGRLFQVFAAATGKVRSPIIQSRIDVKEVTTSSWF